ncbi:MAG: DUF5658 family protein [Acidobacteriota bacterium]
MNQAMVQYSYLQVLDFLTTVAFLLQGVREGNPFVKLAMLYAPNPLGGLLFIKVLALGLGVYCWKVGRQKLLNRMSIMFALVVAWNLSALIIGSLGPKVL